MSVFMHCGTSVHTKFSSSHFQLGCRKEKVELLSQPGGWGCSTETLTSAVTPERCDQGFLNSHHRRFPLTPTPIKISLVHWLYYNCTPPHPTPPPGGSSSLARINYVMSRLSFCPSTMNTKACSLFVDWFIQFHSGPVKTHTWQIFNAKPAATASKFVFASERILNVPVGQCAYLLSGKLYLRKLIS